MQARVAHPRLVLPLLLAAALGAACAAPPLPEEAPVSVSPLVLGPGERLAVDQVHVITDASGTMYARKTFPMAKALTRSFVAGMPDGSYRAGMLSFGGTEREGVPMGALDRAALSANADALRILGDIDGRGGTTPFHRVFGEVQQEVGSEGGTLGVVVFSDGLPDRKNWALDAASALAASQNGAVCFHTVQTGADPEGTAYLQELAALTACGTNRHVSSIQQPAAYTAFLRDVFVTGGGPAPSPARTRTTPPATGTGSCDDVLRLRGVEFDFDKSDIRPDAAPVLDVAVDQLRACPNVSLRIDGHTDWTGTEAYNQGLSERRAEAVRRYLVGNGIPSSRLTTRGLGEGSPIATNETREGRARNRRVELHPN